MVLGVPERRDRGRLAGTLAAVGARVVAVQADRRAVVVQLAAVDLELRDHTEHQLRQQRPAVAVKQRVERAADTIVVEQRRFAGRQAQQPWVMARGPVGQAVERLARHTQVAHQHADRGSGADRDTLVAGRQMTLQQHP